LCGPVSRFGGSGSAIAYNTGEGREKRGRREGGEEGRKEKKGKRKKG